MAKRPPIPFHLIENLYEEEDAIIAAFTRVVIRMIGRGIIERPEEAYIKKMACLDSKDWDKYQTRLKTLLESFYEPFIESWKKYHCKSGIWDKKAILMRKANALKRALVKRHVTNVTELTIKDAADEFSMQPVKLERTTRHNETPTTSAPVLQRAVKASKPLSGTLKDV